MESAHHLPYLSSWWSLYGYIEEKKKTCLKAWELGDMGKAIDVLYKKKTLYLRFGLISCYRRVKKINIRKWYAI